jgi:hypothetical protein
MIFFRNYFEEYLPAVRIPSVWLKKHFPERFLVVGFAPCYFPLKRTKYRKKRTKNNFVYSRRFIFPLRCIPFAKVFPNTKYYYQMTKFV